MSKFTVQSIGTIFNSKKGTFIQVDKKYIPALQAWMVLVI